MKKKKRMILKEEVPDKFEGGKWSYKTRQLEVTVLAIADKYAMVRRPGCVPFVAREKDLHDGELNDNR